MPGPKDKMKHKIFTRLPRRLPSVRPVRPVRPCLSGQTDRPEICNLTQFACSTQLQLATCQVPSRTALPDQYQVELSVCLSDCLPLCLSVSLSVGLLVHLSAARGCIRWCNHFRSADCKIRMPEKSISVFKSSVVLCCCCRCCYKKIPCTQVANYVNGDGDAYWVWVS